MHVIQKALATIEDSDLNSEEYPHGGFTAVLSTPNMDRDGDELLREEWQDLPDRIPIDVDHGMSVASTVGSGHPYWDTESGRMMIDVAFSSIPRAQETRSLVKEGHISGISVAFMTDKTKKDGVPKRELLNAGIVAIPANRDAVILSAKEFAALKEQAETKAGKEPYGDVTYADPGYQQDGQKRYPLDSEEHVRAAWSYIHQEKNRGAYTAEQLSSIESKIRSAAKKYGIQLEDSKAVVGDVETKASQAESSLIQGIHDAACHLGATCAGQTEDNEPDPDSGDDDGANKSAGSVTVEVKPELDLDAFKEQLEKLTALKESSGVQSPDSPQDDESAPADAASKAATAQVPADEPAEAADVSDEVAEKQAADLMASLLESDLHIAGLNF